MMAEVFPFVQVNIPGAASGEVNSGLGGGAAANADSDPALFDRLMAECSAAGEPDGASAESACRSALEQVCSLMQGSPSLFPQPVLDLLASLGDGLQPETPELQDGLLSALDSMKDELELSDTDTKNNDGVQSLKQLLAMKNQGIPILLPESVPDAAPVAAENVPASPLEVQELLMEGLIEEDAQGADSTEASVSVEEAGSRPVAQSPEEDDDELSQGEGDNLKASEYDTGARNAIPLAGFEAVADQDAPEMKDAPSGMDILRSSASSRRVENAAAQASALNRTRQTATEGAANDNKNADSPVSGGDASRDASPLRSAVAEATNDAGARQDAGTNQPGQDGRSRQGGDRSGAEGLRSAGADQRRTADTVERRDDVRQDFQSFFEGVLSNHRTASREAPAPLNLRTILNQDYTQASVLRDGLVNVVRFVRADGEQRANVIVDPPALGRITVELTAGTSGVEASIKVASEQVRQLVQEQVTELRMTLAQQGVQLAQFAVDVQQDDSRRQQDFGQQRRRGRRVEAVEEAADDPLEFRVDLEQGLLYWVA